MKTWNSLSCQQQPGSRREQGPTGSASAQRLANALYAGLTRHGRGAGYRHLLSVPGRRSGEVRSTPVDVMHVDGSRWVVAPYGEVELG